MHPVVCKKDRHHLIVSFSFLTLPIQVVGCCSGGTYCRETDDRERVHPWAPNVCSLERMSRRCTFQWCPVSNTRRPEWGRVLLKGHLVHKEIEMNERDSTLGHKTQLILALGHLTWGSRAKLYGCYSVRSSCSPTSTD
jgi:hypothetical protein